MVTLVIHRLQLIFFSPCCSLFGFDHLIVFETNRIESFLVSIPRLPAGSSISRRRCLASPRFDSQLNRFYVFMKDLDLEFPEKKRKTRDSNLCHIQVNTMKPVLTPKTRVPWRILLNYQLKVVVCTACHRGLA